MKINPQEILEQISLEKTVEPIVQRILAEYNTSNPEGLRMALRQAVWEGICNGKCWK